MIAHARLLALVLAPLAIQACGGKLLPWPSLAADAATGDDGGADGGWAPGPPAEGADAWTSGSSSGYGGSSSSGSSSGAPGGGSSSGPAPTPCLSAHDCDAGLICCSDINLVTGCRAGPCPPTSVGPIQLCATAAECKPGQTCGPLRIAPQDPITACGPM